MPTNHREIFAALAAPFDQRQVRQRSQGGRQLSYITARTAANRLDEVLGPEMWKPEFTETKDGMKCRIWYRLDEGGEWLWKEDGGGFANMAEEDNNEKSAYSDSFKRAAVMLGVGRHLYQDGIPDFGRFAGGDASLAPVAHHHPEPSRPTVNLVPGRRQQEADARRHKYDGQPPGNGRALFAWVKKREEQTGCGYLNLLNAWGKDQEFPRKMVDWNEDQVALAYNHALTIREGRQPGDDGPDD